jgi:putative endopeptidase
LASRRSAVGRFDILEYGHARQGRVALLDADDRADRLRQDDLRQGQAEREPEGARGLGLSDRQLYLEERFAPQKTRYQQYVAQMLGLAGWENAEAAAEAIVALETRIAEAHWTREESRNRDRTYNPMTLAELERDAPGFPWATFFRAARIDHAERAVVSQNTAFPKIARIFAETDLDTLKAWQAFHSTDNAAPLLSRAFVDAHFDFRSRFLQGQPEQRERPQQVEPVIRAVPDGTRSSPPGSSSSSRALRSLR